MGERGSLFHTQAIEAVKGLWRKYFVEKAGGPMEYWLVSILSEDFVLIGTGVHEFYQGRDVHLEALQKSMADPTEFTILDEKYYIQEICKDICLVYGMVKIKEKTEADKAIKIELDIRFSITCKNTGNGVAILNLHQSLPSLDLEKGEYYPKSIADKANKAIQLSKQLEKYVTVDSMTHLYNRLYTEKYIDQFLKNQCASGAFFMIDLDNFKKVNDSLGHLKGDEVIKKFSDILKEVFGKDDIIGRVGGDEFVVFAASLSSEREISRKAHAVIDKLERAANKYLHTQRASCSIGIALAPAHGRDFNTLYINADKALYLSKRENKGTVSFYNSPKKRS